MDKVQVTREQAEMIEDFKEKYTLDLFVINRNGGFGEEYQCLLDLTVDEMARALYANAGYKIKPEFQEGDYVIDVFEGILKVESIKKSGLCIANENDKRMFLFFDSERYQKLKHANEEEVEREIERRIEKKLDNLLLDLNNEERVILQRKLNGEN